jgi:predicted nucleic acid-binding protein
MSNRVCVDASFIVTLLVPERFSQAALSLWEEWIAEDASIVAPGLLRYEATSALYRKAFRDLLTWDDTSLALEQLLKLDIEWLDPAGLPKRASELAREFSRPNTYDAFYLALAEMLDIGLWTGDARLFNALRSRFENIHWLGGADLLAG